MTLSFRHFAQIAFTTCLSFGAHAAVVDFSGLPTGENPNPLELSGATFTTVGGFNYVSQGALCPSPTADNPANCARTLEVAFSAGASDISFEFRANNNHTVGADIGDVAIYSGATLLDTLDMLVVDDTTATFDLVRLTGFGNVTRIVIDSTDFGGLVYDNFRFNLSNAVPEPTPWALALAAAGLGGWASRRRQYPAEASGCKR